MPAKARLEGVLDVNKQPFVKGMNDAVNVANKSGKKMEGAFKGLGRNIAGFMSVGLVTSKLRQSLDFSGQLQDTSDALNLTTDSLQGFIGAFGESGATSQQVEKGFVKLNQSIDDARNGSEKAMESFETLGVSFGDLERKSPEQIIYQIANAARNTTNPTKTLAAIMDVLGKNGAKLAPGLKLGADGLKQLVDSVQKLSASDIKTLDDAGDALVRLGLKMTISAAEGMLGWKVAFREIEIGYDKLMRMLGKPVPEDKKAAVVQERIAEEQAHLMEEVVVTPGRRPGFWQQDLPTMTAPTGNEPMLGPHPLGSFENFKSNIGGAGYFPKAAANMTGKEIGLSSGGLVSGGLSGSPAGNAHSIVRRGDAARAKAARAEAEKEKAQKVLDPNAGELVRIWGGTPKQ